MDLVSRLVQLKNTLGTGEAKADIYQAIPSARLNYYCSTEVNEGLPIYIGWASLLLFALFQGLIVDC